MEEARVHEEETAGRAAELKALAAAKKLIAEKTGGAEEAEYGSASFLQIRSHLASRADLVTFEVVRFVRDLADRQKSQSLAQLASRVASAARISAGAGEDPFAKVKGLIEDMLERLTAEASADAQHKAFCDKAMRETNAKKDEKTAEIAKLTTRIDQASAMSAQLKEETAALQKELAELAASQAQMDKMRKEEKAAFVQNKADYELGLEAVKLALNMLREYYDNGKQAQGAAKGAASGIIGLLEVIESDFSKSLAEVEATEETAEKEYVAQTKENEIATASKEQDVKYKTEHAAKLDAAVADMTTDREGVQNELDAVNKYLEELDDMCISKVEPYEERKRRREAELAGLKQALAILEGAGSSLIQRSSKRVLRGAF